MGFRHQFSLASVVIMIILLKPSCGRDAILVKSNTTYPCNGLLNECRIGQDLELELDFLMDSNIIRILQGGSNFHPGIEALDANKAVQFTCHVDQICYPEGHPEKKAKCKNTFACKGQIPVSTGTG